MYKIRFHLGSGKHCRHWQIKSKDEVLYFDPYSVQVTMEDCVLKRTKKAEKVYAAQVRDVCGWVECEKFCVESTLTNIYEPISINELDQAMFDPKICPYWKVEGDSDFYTSLRIGVLVSKNDKLYIKENYRGWADKQKIESQ